MLQEKTIKELQTIIRECGKDINLEEVTRIANGLVNYFDLLGKIYHREKIKEETIEKVEKN